MFDWTALTDNPVDEKVYFEMLNFINKTRKFETKSYREFLKEKVENKEVLDIGAVEHDISHINSEKWKHNFIRQYAKNVIGIDILKNLVDFLNKKGYNFICVDATSKEYLGKKFDIVHIGDVIEHVDNPINLMKFAKRHLKDEGIIIVSTPSPYFYKYIFRLLKEKTLIANFEHISWITPTLMVEIYRRSGLIFDYHIYFLPNSTYKKILKKLMPEIFSGTYIYILYIKKIY